MRKTLVVLALAAALPMIPARAHAQQVSDEERLAARNLYFDGVKLQDAGNYAEALDKFTRAQKIFSAPTHVLRIAECQAGLNKLVEAVETYRTVIKADLGKNPPPAFTQAQQQAAAELPQVEARIPSLKVDVQPQNVQNPVLTVNGAPVNAALIGVARPINPGTHTVSVTAPGYGKAEQTVTLKEKEQRAITLTLQPGGVVYGPTPVIPVYTVPAQGQPAQNPPPGQNPPPQDKPPEYKPDKKPEGSSAGFFVGPRLGFVLPAGDVVKKADGSSLKFSDVMTGGVGLGLEAGFRVASKLLIGAMYEFGVYGQADAVTKNVNSSDTVTTAQRSNFLAGFLGFTSNPEGTGFYGEFGFGYRWFSQDHKVVSAGGASAEDNSTFKGTEFDFGIGAWVKAGNSLRFVPKLSLTVGSFADATCDGNACGGTGGGSTSVSLSSDQRQTHTVVFLGLSGYFNLDFGKADKSEAPTAAAPASPAPTAAK